MELRDKIGLLVTCPWKGAVRLALPALGTGGAVSPRYVAKYLRFEHFTFKLTHDRTPRIRFIGYASLLCA
jgi:hypothetical protein